MGRAAALCSYLPVPGLAPVLALGAPADRLVRFHAWQGGTLTLVMTVLLIALGLLLGAVPRPALIPVAALAGALTLAWLLAILAGARGAAQGRFLRLPGIWHALAALKPRPSSP